MLGVLRHETVVCCHGSEFNAEGMPLLQWMLEWAFMPPPLNTGFENRIIVVEFIIGVAAIWNFGVLTCPVKYIYICSSVICGENKIKRKG